MCYVGLGEIPRELTLLGSELEFLTSNGLTLGGASVGTVSGIMAAHSAKVSGVLTMLFNRDNAQVTFAGSGSTFNTLSVQADDGISIVASLSTDVGECIKSHRARS